MTSRRKFVATLAAAGTGALALRPRPARLLAGLAAQSPRATPSPSQLAWQDLEVGMFIHFAPNTWQDREYDDSSTPLSAIDPEIDTDQWADTAVGLGARYIVLVAKHTGGFCLWQTGTTDYSIKNTRWRGGRGDVMADLAESCARRGLQLGVYLSPRDDSQGAGGGGRCATPERQAAYDAIYRQQLTELLTRYGDIVEIWFDGSIVIATGDLLARHAPDAMVFQGPHATIRWVGNEDGFASYPTWSALMRADADTGIATAAHGDPDGDVWMPVEVDVSLRRPNWFWSTTNHVNLLSLDQLLDIYYRSVGRGAQLLLNVTPDRTGRVPEADARRLRELRNAVTQRFGSPLGEAAGSGDLVTVDLGHPRQVDHVIAQEDLAGGERVRAYRLEGLADGAWMPLGIGTAVGHKRIHPVGPATLRAVRLVSTEAVGTPGIRRLAVYDSGARPPDNWRDSVHVWADDAAGEWSDGRCRVDLTPKVTAATEYRLRFVPEGGGDVALDDVELLIGGTARPERWRFEPGRTDVLILTIPALSREIMVLARVRGAPAGMLLLRRL